MKWFKKKEKKVMCYFCSSKDTRDKMVLATVHGIQRDIVCKACYEDLKVRM